MNKFTFSGLLFVLLLPMSCADSRARLVEPPPPRELCELELTAHAEQLQQVTREAQDEFAPDIGAEGRLLLHQKISASNGVTESSQINLAFGDALAQRQTMTTSQTLADHGRWLDDTSLLYTSNLLGEWSVIHQLALSQDAPRRVLVAEEYLEEISWPRLSPNRQKLAFQAVLKSQRDLGPQVFVKDLDASGLLLLGPGLRPAWSNNSTDLAFSRAVDEIYQIFLVSADGTALRQLTHSDRSLLGAAWQPHHNLLAATRQDEQGWNLVLVSQDGELLPLTQGSCVNDGLTWANENSLLFHSDAAGNFDIWTLKIANPTHNSPN